jgi:4-hydroxyproline epimerase
MTRHTFTCIDGHTCGNPVRVVTSGAPELPGVTMVEKRQQFIAEYDWIRTGLMFEPRGHDMMSGAFILPPTREDCDCAFLFIETTGCLPMCGHGTIGTVTIAIERGLVTPQVPGILRLDTPAGVVVAKYFVEDGRVSSVRITNVASYLRSTGLAGYVEGLGEVKVDVAYGGNFYAIVDPQEVFKDIADVSPLDLIGWSAPLRSSLNQRYQFIHPEDETIFGISHILWTGRPTLKQADARNAVFYGEKALDRSPCGTGTSARMAQWHAQGKLKVGDSFIHESLIHTTFSGRIEREVMLAGRPAIIPSIEGWARITGDNTLYIDECDPLAHGFQVI